MYLQTSCRSSHCPNTSLVSPGPTPNLSLSRYPQAFQKNMSFQAINWQVPFIKMTLQPTFPRKVKQNTSSGTRILKLFDSLDFTSTMYQPSDHYRTLAQAQHRPSAKIQELNTNDLSFTLDGVLSTLQQGSAENGVGSPIELRYHVKKRRAQIWSQIQRLIKISTGLRRQTRTSNTHTKHKRRACSRKPNYTRTPSCQENCFTLDHQNFYRTTQANAYVKHAHQTQAQNV